MTFNKYILRSITQNILSQIIAAIILLVSVGSINNIRVWITIIFLLLFQLIDTAIIYLQSQELLYHRGQRKKGTESFDSILLPLYFLIGFYLTMITAGLDIGRFHWSYLPKYWIIPGIIFFVFSYILSLSAMKQNPYFESTVRIQTERNQTVVTTGPYRYVRHPGYTASIIWGLSLPLLLGSLVAFIPSIIGIVLIILRTIFEDAFLQKKLKGYSDYVSKVPYRLIPFLW